MQIRIEANDGSEIFQGDVDEMPAYGEFVDVYEEAVNMSIESGKTQNGWAWEVA